MIVVRKDGRGRPTPAELEAPEPAEPREFAALRFAVRVVSKEVQTWRGLHDRALEEHDRAVEFYGRAAEQHDRAVGFYERAVEEHGLAVGFYERAVTYARQLEDELERARVSTRDGEL